MRHIELNIRSIGSKSSVEIDGEMLPLDKAVVTVEVGEVTVVDLRFRDVDGIYQKLRGLFMTYEDFQEVDQRRDIIEAAKQVVEELRRSSSEGNLVSWTGSGTITLLTKLRILNDIVHFHEETLKENKVIGA